MAKKKLEITATSEEIQNLQEALEKGVPLLIALEFSGISQATYFYWIAMYSIVKEAKMQDELSNFKANEFGVSVDNIKTVAAESSPTKKTSMSAFIEPSAESMLQYRNNRKFHKFADQCYEIIKECNQRRAKAAVEHIETINKSTVDKRINASGSMWFLERQYSELYSKPSEKAKEEEPQKPSVEPIQVEFIDPGTKENKDRIREMEEKILSESKEPAIV